MNWKGFLGVMFALLVALMFMPTRLAAQATINTGSIQGIVTDAQGGVVPGAKVTISNKETGGIINSSASSSGQFSASALSPGTYVVRVEAPNFKTAEISVVVEVGQVSTVNTKLEVGSSTTVLEVTGQEVTINTEQSQLAGTLTSQQIENLPINGRNFLDLAQLEPGVQIQDGGNFDPTKIGFSSISFGGKFGRSARISVDGVDVSDENVGTTTTGLPSSAIQEFQLAQSNLDVSNDLTSGGSVNVITKSGTNSLHGEAFGLYRDNSQAAAYPAGAQFQRSQYGGDVGGAIIKDKLFFFVDAERLLAHDAGGVLVANIPDGATNLNNFNGTFPAPFHDTSVIGKLDWQIAKNIRAFGRFSYWQASDEGNFGGAANYSVYDNKDRTKTLVGGVDINTGSITHSFRAEYLKFVNVISDAVIGSDLPFADLPTSIVLAGTGFASGPSDLAPQSTIQSDRQVKYDGSKVYGNHIIRWGVDYNRITGWTFASFFGITPVSESLTLNAPGGLTCPGGETGAACPLNYIPDIALVGNGQGSFTELKEFGKSSGGLGPDNRVGVYAGDSWKIKPNLTINYAMRYDRDTGRTDSDLGPLPGLNTFFPGAGDAVRNPNKNFAPNAGFAWSPGSDNKTVIRGGVGIYYDNTVFNDVLFDRLLRLQNGAFNNVGTACAFGGAGSVQFGGTAGGQLIGGSGPAGGVICNTPIGATVGAGGGNCTGMVFANCLAAFQAADQASWAANPTGPNGQFIPSALTNGELATTGLLDPNYKSPRSIQMNIGVQRELRPGMVFSADYVRNVGLHYLLATDINHSGDVTLFNLTNAQAAVAATLAACGAGSVTAAAAPGGCASQTSTAAPNGAATIQTFGAFGLDSAYDQGAGGAAAATNPAWAFPGQNPEVGPLYQYHSGGRSVYNGMDLKFTQNVRNPLPGLKYLNFQATYTLSRYVNAGSTASGTGIAGGDSDFVNNAISNRNPLAFIGPGSLDRTNQINLGGYGDLPYGFRLGLLSHFWSPLAATPTVLPVTGGAQSGAPGGIFTSDFIGSGQVGNPLPGSQTSSSCGDAGGTCNYDLYNVGAFMRSLGPAGLATAVNNYNSTIGGQLPTPAGQALINSGLFTLANLQALGGVAATVPGVVPGQVGYSWLKAFDLEFSWVGHAFHERLSITPSVSVFNLFNFSNFDSAANALTGQLNGGPGSINGTVQAGRPDRIGAGTGVFAFGAPRTIEWGLKLQF
jgi:hypothetical protein